MIASRAMPDDEAAIGSETSTVEVMGICRRRINDFRGLSLVKNGKDAVQQAVARVLEAIARETVTDVAAFARRVAYHCAVDVWRRNKAEAAKADSRTDRRLARTWKMHLIRLRRPISWPTRNVVSRPCQRLRGDVRQWVVARAA